MRVLVTGGAGYIGSHVARQLAKRGHGVVIYDNLSVGHRCFANGFPLVDKELSDPTALSSALRDMDAVMHFAAYAYVGESIENPRKYFDNNVKCGLALLNAVIDAAVPRFVFSSTCAVYGIPERNPISEETARDPVNPYGVSKLFLENALEAYSNAYGLRYVSLRYFNAAGADESGDIGEFHCPETHLIPCALQVAAGYHPEVELYGDDYPTPDGTCIRDFVHVSDLAEGHLAALDYLAAGGHSTAVNLGTGRGYSVKEVLSTIEDVTNRVLPVRIKPRRPGDPPILVADASRAQRILNWSPSRSMRDMVSDAWRWMQKIQEDSSF